MTYSDLLQLGDTVLHRSDQGVYAPTAITLANAIICRKVHTARRVVRTTWDITGGEFTLPSDFVNFCSIPLNKVSPNEFIDLAERMDTAGRYAQEGDTLLVDGDLSIKVAYNATLLLDADNPTNGTLTKHPDVYQWAVLAEHAAYLQDMELETMYRAKFASAVSSVNQVHDW